jgi:hypothetical protein
MLRCRQHLYQAPMPRDRIADTVRQQCIAAGLEHTIRSGMSVAIAAGSRGIDAYDVVIKVLVQWLKDRGAHPFIFPAMGSHGGATAEGQLEMLATLGVSEKTVGCPIRSSMDVVELGAIPSGLKVYLDRYASEADAIIAVNRVKEHTNFHGHLESGLCKMLSIGAGKHAQAIAIHGHGVIGLRDYMPQVTQMILDRAPVVAGIAMIEDATHQLSRVVGIPAGDILDREATLLREVKSTAPRLPVEDLDLLIVERMGKNISGLGMDTNVTGRCGLLDLPGFDTPRVRCLVVLDLTEESHGNAIGIGLADLIPQRLANKVDRVATAINGITAIGPQQACMPVTLENDREVLRTALDYFCAHRPFDQVSVIRIRDTLSLSEIQVSESLRPALAARGNLDLSAESREMAFDSHGTLL